MLPPDESGAKASNHVNSKAAPVFALFIDCVWQLQQQHPTAFEFNGRYLCCLLNGAASGRFGTLLFDSLADRVAARCSAAHAIALPVDGGNAAPRSGSSSDPARSSSGSGSSASGGESASAGTRPGRAALPSLWTWLRARGDRVRNPAFALSSQSNATDADVPLSRAIHRLAFDAAAVRFWAPYHLQHTRADRFTPPQHTRYRHQHFHHLDCAHHGSGGDSDEDSDDDSGHCRYSDPAERVVRAALKNARRAQTGAREWERVWAASLCRDVLLRRWAAAAVDASAAQCAGNGSK